MWPEQFTLLQLLYVKLKGWGHWHSKRETEVYVAFYFSSYITYFLRVFSFSLNFFNPDNDTMPSANSESTKLSLYWKLRINLRPSCTGICFESNETWEHLVRAMACGAYQMWFGFSIYQREDFNTGHCSIILNVLLHFHVLRVSHEKCVGCFHCLVQLVKL